MVLVKERRDYENSLLYNNFFLVIACIFILDFAIWDGVLLRDFKTNFVHQGMSLDEVEEILGELQREISLGIGNIKAYQMPFGREFQVGYWNEPVVEFFKEANGNVQRWRGYILPLIILGVFHCELYAFVVDRCIIHRKRQEST